VLVDTDAGVDDALAILYAMHSPEIRVEAITTVAGNVEVEKCTRNVKTILAYAQSDYKPEVVQGCGKPLRLALITAPEVHGKDGLGNTQISIRGRSPRKSQEAIECIRRLCEQFSHQLTIIALGPLTNIAIAFETYPHSVKKVKRIVSMGGAFRVPGNTGPVAEFNYFVDPHAANVVLQAGLPLTIVPLDVTEQTILMRSKLQEIVRRRRTRLASFIYKFTGNYMRYQKRTLGINGGYLHDPLTVAIAVRPSLAQVRKVHVEVECESELTRGMTVADFRLEGKGVRPDVVMRIDRQTFHELFYQRVLAF
jgi:purine nucleosidase/pyrimidine-specific ribonucleoside hydrolase